MSCVNFQKHNVVLKNIEILTTLWYNEPPTKKGVIL